MRGLIEKVKKSDHITVLENVSIDRIMTDNNTIYGVIGRFTDDNVPDSNVIIQSSHVVLATGGLGGIFANTTNPRSSYGCLLYTSPSPRDSIESRMPSSA